MPPGIAQMSAGDLMAWFEAKTAAQGKTLDEAWDEVHADWDADEDGWRRILASELEAALRRVDHQCEAAVFLDGRPKTENPPRQTEPQMRNVSCYARCGDA
jgi:hypothetical protein